MIKNCANCKFNDNSEYGTRCLNKIVETCFTFLMNPEKGIYTDIAETSSNNKVCGIQSDYKLFQPKENKTIVKTVAKTFQKQDKHALKIINRLSDTFQQNGLILPEASKQLKLNPKFISKIPFYICVLTWLYAIASLLK